jgi:hypothetical protein
MPRYYRLNETGDLVVAVGELEELPTDPTYFEFIEGSPKIGQSLINGVWVSADKGGRVGLTREQFILKIGREVYQQLKEAELTDSDAAWALMLQRQTAKYEFFDKNEPIVVEFLQSLVDSTAVTAFGKGDKDAFFV